MYVNALFSIISTLVAFLLFFLLLPSPRQQQQRRHLHRWGFCSISNANWLLTRMSTTKTKETGVNGPLHEWVRERGSERGSESERREQRSNSANTAPKGGGGQQGNALGRGFWLAQCIGPDNKALPALQVKQRARARARERDREKAYGKPGASSRAFE